MRRPAVAVAAMLAGVLAAVVPIAPAAPVRESGAAAALQVAQAVQATRAVQVAQVEAVQGAQALREAHVSDASADRIHASTAVPDPKRKVGEVRLLSRGDAVVVQTLLSTRLLSRVVAEIHQKEERNWPAEGSDGAASRAYLAALDAARERLEALETGGDGGDRHRRLLIEFAADAGDAAVLVGTFKSASATDLTPREREIFATLRLPRAYILRQIRLVLADSFKRGEADVDELGPLGPAASAPSSPKTSRTPDPEASRTPDPKASGH